MPIPSGVILIWTSTHASIPTGWSRETSLDDKFPKGHGSENPNTSGGSATHTHTSPTHSHSLGAHTHTYSYGYGQTDWSERGGNELPDAAHQHLNLTTDNPSSATSSSNAVTYGSCSNEPPYYTVIFIKPSGAYGLLRQGISCHYNGTSLPTGWNFCDGNNSTPDLRDKYLKGASTGSNAGTIGGSTTNVHNITHGHTGASHTHTFTTDTFNTYTMDWAGGSDGEFTGPHSHTGTSGASSSDTINDFTGDLTTLETIEPSYKKIGVITNSSAPPTYTKGMIGLWLGTVGTIPSGWQVCDGTNGTLDLRDLFLKVPSNLAGNNTTGGSNTHTHAAQNHSHTGASHTHSMPRIYHWDGSGGSEGVGDGLSNPIFSSTYHETVTSGATSSNWTNSSTTADSSNNQPPYLTVAYIQAMKNDAGGIGAFFV